ncbi:MAG: DoxX family protein [Terriglobales bacterium]|jgi:putative oxidoreductase
MSTNPALGPIVGIYRLFARIASLLQSPFLLAVRAYWGWQFLQTGLGKLHDLNRVTGFFATLGIPFPHANAVFVALLEFAGGSFLIVGLGSRLMGFLLAADMLVAYWTADREALHAVFTDPGKFYNADPFTFLISSLLVFMFGAGVFSLDYLISRRFRSER